MIVTAHNAEGSCGAMIKYTLYCARGQIFRSGPHFLYIGDWLEWHPDMVLLHHGLLTDAEARQIRTQEYVNIYQDARFGCVSIVEPYAPKYLQRKDLDSSKLTQYIGYLTRETPYFYTGRVHVK